MNLIQLKQIRAQLKIEIPKTSGKLKYQNIQQFRALPEGCCFHCRFFDCIKKECSTFGAVPSEFIHLPEQCENWEYDGYPVPLADVELNEG